MTTTPRAALNTPENTTNLHQYAMQPNSNQSEQPAPVPTPAEAAAPTAAAAPVQFSQATQLLISSQAATVQDVTRQMKATPRQAARLLKEMKELYGPVPTLLNLALFSGAPDLMEMITAPRKSEAVQLNKP